jgi:hypothetical protein
LNLNLFSDAIAGTLFDAAAASTRRWPRYKSEKGASAPLSSEEEQLERFDHLKNGSR